MNHLKKALYTVLVMMFAVVAFSSCDKNLNEPLDGNQYEETSSLVQDELRAVKSNNSDLTGWNMIINKGASYGYKLYEKDGNYLQKVNLKLGAYLVPGVTKSTPNPDLSASPLYSRTSMQTFWRKRPSKALSVTNCQFFVPKDDVNTGTNPCPLSYPIKYRGTILSTGSTNDDGIPKRKLGINTSSKEAWVASYQNNSNDASVVSSHLQSPTVIVGTDPYLDKTRKPAFKIGRTMIGILDQDGDGKKEVLYILTGGYKQSDAVDVLTSLGCLSEDIIMLDGHYSSQMMAQGVDYYSSVYLLSKRRNVPCVFYVVHR